MHLKHSDDITDSRWTNTTIELPEILTTISKELHSRGAKAIIVGGSVRDHFLGLDIKDYDVEVYGLGQIEELERLLSSYGSVNQVGRSFGVLKFIYDAQEYDFSSPRKESKVARGHRGFDVEIDDSLEYGVAARRRDFTINALGFDIESGELIDPFGGLDDLRDRRLKHIDDGTFVEDPLRVYRAVQFCARFEFELDDSTRELCLGMVSAGTLEELPKERIYAEWQKLLLKSKKPSIGFELMLELGIIERYSPELYAIVGVAQSPVWHPEGDVWVHTMMTIDKMRELLIPNPHAEDKYRLRLLLGALCHDLGKATDTTIELESTESHRWLEGGRELYHQALNSGDLDSIIIRSIGHESSGVEPARDLLYRLTDEHGLIDSILPLIEHHMKPSQFYRDSAGDGAIRRLATKVQIEELLLVSKADFLGRTTKESLAGIYHAGEWLQTKALRLSVSRKAPTPLLRGLDLITLGMKPSPVFGEILDSIYQCQLAGTINTKEQAIQAAKQHKHSQDKNRDNTHL